MSNARESSLSRRFDQLWTVGTAAGRSEGQLIERFAETGDEISFEAILTRHGPMVLTVCRRILREEHDAADAFQATFLILVRKAGSIRNRETLGPWLHGVARRVAVRARQNARRRATIALDNTLASAADHDVLETREASARLHDEIERLPAKYRDPIVLCHLQGWTHEEAAACLKWPVGTVRGRLSRARELLRRRLERRGVTSTSASFVAPALYDAAARLAVVPDPLRAATLRAALGFAATRSLVGFVSAHVFTLVNGAIEAMFAQQLKWIAVGTCGLGLLAAGGTTLAYQLAGKPDPKGVAKITAPSRIAQDARSAEAAPASEQTPSEVNYDALDKASSEGEIAQMKLKLLQTRLQKQQQIVYDLEFDPSPIYVRRGANLIVLPEQATAEELEKVRAERDANVAHARRLLKTLEERFDAASHEVADAKRRAEAIKAPLKAVPSGLKTVGTHAPGRDSTPAELDAAALDLEGKIADWKAEIVLAKEPVTRYLNELKGQHVEDSTYVSLLGMAKSNLEAARKQLRGEPSATQYADPNAAKQGLEREIAEFELKIKVAPEQRAKLRRKYLEDSKRLANLEYQLKRLEAERDRVSPGRGSATEGKPAGLKPTKAE